MNEILDIQNRAYLRAYAGTIFVSYAPGLINEHANNRRILGARDLCVDHLESVVTRSLFRNFANAICNRSCFHDKERKSTICATFRPKEKVGQNPPDNLRRSEQAVDYTITIWLKQGAVGTQLVCCYGGVGEPVVGEVDVATGTLEE